MVNLAHKKKEIDPESLVTAHAYGDTLELSTALGGTPVMTKISRDEMANRETGEITEIHHITSRADPKNYESLRATLKSFMQTLSDLCVDLERLQVKNLRTL